MTLLPLCRLLLAQPLRRSQIHAFRGAVAEAAGLENHLFHNHSTDREKPLYYRYPLIQYKVMFGHAAIVGLGDGAKAMRALIPEDGLLFAGKFPILERRDENFPLGMAGNMKPYFLCQWIALNKSNYERWKEIQQPIARRMELERILTAHLLAFASGVNFTVPRPRGLVVEIDETTEPQNARCHDGKLVTFDVRFSANIHLPLDAGIGKSASHGFGCIWPDRKLNWATQKSKPEAFAWEME